MSNKVEEYINKRLKWSNDLTQLRAIFKKAGLEEGFKWSMPVCMHEGKNILGYGATKQDLYIWFFQGALLTDPDNRLINAQKDKTQAMRQWRLEQITDADKRTILSFVREAIENQRQGREIKPRRNKPLVIPEELIKALDENDLTATFKKMNLTKRRDFAEYISTAKRSDTKDRRIEKIIPMINDGIGLNDKYKK